MIRRLQKVCATLALAFFALIDPRASHASKETITWTQNDFIPFYIKEGPFKGQGISDKLTAFFQKHLTEYEHRQEHMTMARFLALAERQNLVCNPLILMTEERMRALHYSNPVKPSYGHVLLSTHPIDFPADGLDLASYLQSQAHSLIVQANRSYGPILDETINEAIAQRRATSTNYSTEKLMTLVLSDRHEHFVDVETSAVYFLKTNPSFPNVYTVPLKDGRLDRFGYSACSQSPAGQRVVEKINALLKKHAASEELRAILESWIAPANLARYRLSYEKHIISRY